MQKTDDKRKKVEKDLAEANAAQKTLEQERDQKTKAIRNLEVNYIHNIAAQLYSMASIITK